MPTITNDRTLRAARALVELVKVKRPILGALRMRSLARVLGTRSEDIEAERQKLIAAHGAKNEDGSVKEANGQIVFADDPAAHAFADAFTELMLCTWDCPMSLKVKDFGGLDVEPDLLIALGELLEEDEPDRDDAKPVKIVR
jgi:hypothetical protein